jgi:hypothetical protein
MTELNVSLLDVLKFKGLNGREIVNEVIRSNPVVTGNDSQGNSIPVASDTISGDSFKGLYRIGNPDIDPFRIINSGAGMDQGSYEVRRFDVATITRYFWVDQAIMNRDAEAGAKMLAAQCANGVEATLNAMEKQFFYGGQKDNGDPSVNGFQGLQKFIPSESVYNAGGSGSKLSSAYLINFNNRVGCSWLFGENGTMAFSDPVDDDIPDPKNSKKMIPIIKTKFEFYPGFAFLSKFGASRICNIDTTTAFTTEKDPTKFTDEMIATAIAKWEAGTPNAIVMTKSAGMMLAASRAISTLVGVGAAGANVPVRTGYVTLPTEHNGIPIAYSTGLIDGEKQVQFS